jgi:hypothetical protein
LSFNTFEDPFLFDQLGFLRKLKKLNLSSNNLRHLPRNLDMLRFLEEFVLESNVLQENVFFALSTCPSLKRVNLNWNFVERVPMLDIPGFASRLEELSLGCNKITYFDDIYSLKEYSNLKLLVLWENPMVNFKKEVDSTFDALSKDGLTIVLDGPIPLASKYLSVSTFYTEKMHTIDTQYPEKPKSKPPSRNALERTDTTDELKPIQLQESSEVIDTLPSSPDLEDEENRTSFFITATKQFDDHQLPRSPVAKLKKAFARQGSLRSVTQLYDSVASSSIKKISEGHEAISNFRVDSRQEYNDEEIPHVEDAAIFDYNGDWFRLDAALDALNDSLRDDPNAQTAGRLYKNDFKSKKRMFSALKFALKNPLSVSAGPKKPPSSNTTTLSNRNNK